jgi:hypothetical protein
VRGRAFGLLLAAAWAFPAGAAAAPVLVMGRHGRVSERNDPFVTTAQLPSGPAGTLPLTTSGPSPARAGAARAPKGRRRVKPRTVPRELAGLYRSRQIDETDYSADSRSWRAALGAARHQQGVRATELHAVIANLGAIAAAGQLTASRLPALFLTLDRNRQWWTTGPLLSTWQRVEFAGSQLVWQYYPGQGIELQVLGNFGKVDGLYAAGRPEYPRMRALLGELIPLAARRAGGLAWEYYFHFDGGSPPWISAMAEGTALEALTRAARAFGPRPYMQVAAQLLPPFTVAPPAGVRVATALGARYLQYSFAPHTDIINAFLQSLIGLFDYARASGSPEARKLFAAGNAQAQAELPRFDTGAWSLYQPGVEDSLDYHELVTGFLDQLCARTHASVYCTTAQHFRAYLRTPPTLRLLTARARAKTPFALRFALSKYSRVGIVVTRGTRRVFLTSADFGYGLDSFEVPQLPAGSYEVRLAATDLAGNFARITGTLQVRAHKRPTHRRAEPP